MKKSIINVTALMLAMAMCIAANGSNTKINFVNSCFLQDTIPSLEDSIPAPANPADTIPTPDISVNLTGYISSVASELTKRGDSVSVSLQKRMPLITIPQYMKGAAPGLYVQENTGEPGSSRQFMFLRGLGQPVLTIKDMYNVQPAVYVNGIPLITDNPFIYNIQTYSVNPAGPATSLLSSLSLDNVEDVRIVKDYKDVALLGPLASNGAIYITTKTANAGENRISVNSFMGYAQRPQITTINAEYEKNFRLPFYYKYGSGDLVSMPAYLSDSSNVSYYGPSNWSDKYYKNTPQYSINAALTGGSERANFRFFGDYTRSVSGQDDTKFDRYNGAFYINMLPTKWLTVYSMINASILTRERNRSFIDRLAEMRFLPNSRSPLAPNLENYNAYLNLYDNTIDNNATTTIQGFWGLNIRISKNLNYDARIAFDYNEGRRDLFWNSSLFDGSNYASNYFGFNQRLIIENSINYKKNLNNHPLNLKGGVAYTGDIQRYNYGIGYNGTNDFIKANITSGDKKNPAKYLVSNGFTTYGFTDKIQQRLMAFYGDASYEPFNGMDVGDIVRSDGYSSMQPSNRWFISTAFNAAYHMAPILKSNIISKWDVFASWGRIGNVRTDQNIGAGPQYQPQAGWGDYPILGSYNSFGVYSRPYNYGWVGYDIPWAYTTQLNIGTEFSVLRNKLSLRVDWYNKDNKNIVFPSPVSAESGYVFEWKSGMIVNNTGLDVTLSTNIGTPNTNSLNWNGSLNFGFNKNKLQSLPNSDGYVVMGDRKLEVNKPIDQFWLLQNTGIYNSNSEIPVDPKTGRIMTYRGIALQAGDPKWTDVNGDYNIDDKDRMLMGNYLPRLSGGFANAFTYKKFDLNFQLAFALKKYSMNKVASGYYDFINRDNANTLESMKEITWWEKQVLPDKYNLYNPWSQAQPYQVNQDIFMEDASYLKLRTLSIGYLLTEKKTLKSIRRVYLYVTGTNLLTLSPYSGRDPELIEFNGYDTGYGQRLPQSFILGTKIDL